jgi:hypothetical protein
MKQGTGVSAFLVAILSSVATISCCLPLGFAAAVGAGAASAFFTTLHPWLLGLSVALLCLGFWQEHPRKAVFDPWPLYRECAAFSSVRFRQLI